MNSIAATLLPGAKIAKNYLESLVKDIPEDVFSRIPRVSDTEITANHAAFHIGHLALYPAKTALLLELDQSDVSAPDNYEALFLKGTACVDDPEGNVYPIKAELCQQCFSTWDKIFAMLPEVSDEVFLKDNPIEAARDRFQTAGQFASFLLHAHTMVHCGQISTLRRVLGLPSLF